MKTKITLLSISFLFLGYLCFAQKKNDAKSFIESSAIIKKYHNINELKEMPKGELLGLYMERINALTKIIPYIAFATKPGVTMDNYGIPNSNENRKRLENQHENTEEYIEETFKFQKAILPYSDTNKLVSAVLFYEDVMKSIHHFEEFN
ncbi:hypothetical protein [Seonamhaeicola marinus]|uniref:Uncharacterized protein n=1 Tax=Seonamhaeicola marinus TaxID=1912246 RepID=A0A5D0HUB7_9FLAO|nr:hypothetical protein [Seonamhaeicola marinus]TYA74510.1 hypothetical protein FUA24_14405 [Seonamhaeicola marinus]